MSHDCKGDMCMDAECMTTDSPALEEKIIQGCACGKPKHRFVYDPLPHKYYLDGKEINGVSRCSELCGLSREFNKQAEQGAAGGTNSHSWFAVWDRGEMDKYEPEGSALNGIEEWKQMRAAFGIERYEAIEEGAFMYARFGEEGIHVAGTGDRVYVAGPKHPMWPEGTRVYQDAKTSRDTPKPSKLYRFKCALYRRIFNCKASELVYIRHVGTFDPRPIREGGSMDFHTSTWDDEIVDKALEFILWRRIG